MSLKIRKLVSKELNSALDKVKSLKKSILSLDYKHLVSYIIFTVYTASFHKVLGMCNYLFLNIFSKEKLVYKF